MVELTIMRPWTMMFGFAWHNDEKMLEVFFGLFAISWKIGVGENDNK